MRELSLNEEYAHCRARWLEARLFQLIAERDGPSNSIESVKRARTLRAKLSQMERRHSELGWHALKARWGLNTFESHVLWLVSVYQFDRIFHDLAATYSGNAANGTISPALCQELFVVERPRRHAALSSFGPSGALVRQGLVRLEPGGTLVSKGNPLFQHIVAAPFVPHLLRSGGRQLTHERPFAARLIRPSLSLDEVAMPDEIRAALASLPNLLKPGRHLGRSGQSGVYDEPRGHGVLLTGPAGSGKSAAARALAALAGVELLVLDGGVLPTVDDRRIGDAIKACVIEAAACGDWLLIDGCEHLFRVESGSSQQDAHARVATMCQLLHAYPVTVMFTAELPEQLPRALLRRLTARVALPSLERRAASLAWQLNGSEERTLTPNLDLHSLGGDTPLTGRGIQSALRIATALTDGMEIDAQTLNSAARWQTPSTMSSVAKLRRVRRARRSLLLPEDLSASIDEIIATERIREQTLRGWGLQNRIKRGLGLVCLFNGDPGTGKTMASEVIATELDLPLYTVAVPNVVSKWIGETEQNLQRVFDDAQRNRCVVLFDEADSLFSKRTEVSRSTDRYSNMAINVLLQLIEDYRGLVLLTTNLRGSIDPAFDRRFAYKLEFRAPEADIRTRIWSELLPADRLAPDVDLKALGQDYQISGGSIRTVVLRATYRAAIDGADAVSQAMLASCAREEAKALGLLVRES